MISSEMTKQALISLGLLVKVARQQRKMSQHELAERLNVTRQTIMAIEKGSEKTSIGVVFEAAYVLGVPLMSGNKQDLLKWQNVLANFDSILPAKVTPKNKEFDDDF